MGSYNRGRPGRRRTPRLLLPAVLGIVLLFSIPVGASGTSAIRPPGAPAPTVALPSVATLALGGSLGSHHKTPFFSLDFDAQGLGPNAATDLGRYFNSTPFTYFRLGEGGIGYDPTTQINWVAPATGGNFVPVSELMINLSWFKTWCDSRTPHCRWIGALPAEENNTTAAVHFATWYHNVLGFPPTAWEFGNEPNAWTHYGKNESQWSSTDNDVPTGLDYATMVHDYIAAIRAVFPQDRFIGIQANCACNPSFVTTLAQVDGPELLSVAYHSYPWTNDSSQLESQFMGSLESTRNLTYTANRMRTLVTAGCANCTRMPIWVGEYNAGPVPDHSPIAMNYSSAPFMAASVIEAIQANVSMLGFYSLAWLYNSTSGTIHPEGEFYQQFLSNLTMGADTNLTLTASGVGGLFAIKITSGLKESILLVNTNITKAINVTIPISILPLGLTGTIRSWDPRSTWPTEQSKLLLPSTYTIWSQGILLINNY